MEANDPDDSHRARESQSPRDVPVDGDALDHLWNAAHEMLCAMRGLLEAADEFVESQRVRSARVADDLREGRVHHIDIDVRNDDPARSDAHTDTP